MTTRKRSVRALRNASKLTTSTRQSERSTSTTKVAASCNHVKSCKSCLTKTLHHAVYRITHCQQHKRINAVLRFRAYRSQEKQYRSNQRECRRDRVTPGAVRSRLVRFATPQDKQRDEGEDVINHEEKREHRD